VKVASVVGACLLLVTTAVAKKRQRPPEAPLPERIAKAKSIFLLSKAESIFYDEAYKQLKDWGRFELVNDPEQADLIFVLTTEKTHLGSVTSGDVSRARYGQNLTLTVLDPKTNVELWTEERSRRLARLEKNREKEKILAVDDLIARLRERLSP
jgi:hypothetical protein